MLTDVRAVAVVGAGAIGTSWSLAFARAGIETRVYDEQAEALASVEARFAQGAELLAAHTDADPDAMRAQLVVVDDLAAAVQGADYVQECVHEELELKRTVFADLDRLTSPETVLASSASMTPMTEIASGLSRPERAVIVHPTNPPHLVPLVEIVPGEQTSPAVTQAAYAFMERLGQRPILCRKEIFGFVLNRIQMALLREALYLHREGIASAADIDRCVTDGLGLRWAFLGPFGVEHTNAASIEEDLRKFGEPIRLLFEDLGRAYDGPTEGDIARLAAEVEELFPGRSHDEICRSRDRDILRLRALKERT